ncbi:MAG: hypothetical protein RBT65_03065 [Methanolobus sp.]|nr:hypothetical protein [Methanolobus sp.]
MKTNMRFGIGALLTAMLLVSMAFVPAVSATEVTNVTENTEDGDIGIKSIGLNGGDLTVDELNGITCSANAGSYSGYYTAGLTYKINVNWEYIDTSDVTLKTAYFKLTGPDTTVDDVSITDYPGTTDSDSGTLSVTFTPPNSGYYHWQIYCSEGSESDSDTGDLILK